MLLLSSLARKSLSARSLCNSPASPSLLVRRLRAPTVKVQVPRGHAVGPLVEVADVAAAVEDVLLAVAALA